jgi:molybdopterin synthase catalytic subunit
VAVRVQDQAIDVGAELASLIGGRTDIGALASFTGIVRDRAGDEPISAMTLEHYPGMTEAKLAAIETEARQRWPLKTSLIVHRVGRMLPGEVIVLVAATSSHRAAALEATAFLIDWLKTRAPFWKAEEIGGEVRWVEARAADDSAAARWGR